MINRALYNKTVIHKVPRACEAINKSSKSNSYYIDSNYKSTVPTAGDFVGIGSSVCVVIGLCARLGLFLKGRPVTMEDKLKIYGFNNLTKALSFNIYDVCYAKSEREQRDYIAYIDEQYNSERLTSILYRVCEMIDATVLNVSKQDYDPQGASVTFLIAEKSMLRNGNGDTVVAHLDKSHVTVHTYPEYHPDNAIATFRVDIDVATCGEITPLSTLDFLIGSFDSDIITMDYRVRGFTRTVDGQKLFLDHDITSIQNYIADAVLRRYDAIDINVYQANLFHTKMLINEIDLQNYLFNTDVYELPPKTRLQITESLRREMIEIFSGRNVYGK